MKKLFIPNSFEPPIVFSTQNFHFRILEEELAEVDLAAVMSSQSRLEGIFGPESQWPKSDMTLAENRLSLQVHKEEFEARTAFAYSVFTSLKDKCLGSVYIDPSQSQNYDCEVYLWVRDDSIALDDVLYQTVLNWLQAVWPFTKVAFPGRVISWQEWGLDLSTVNKLISKGPILD